MARHTIPENSLHTQSSKVGRSLVSTALHRGDDIPKRDSWSVSDGMIEYLAEASNERLSQFGLNHTAEAAECQRELKAKLLTLIDSMLVQRELERAARTQLATDGHFRCQKTIRQEAADLLWELVECRVQHLTLERVANIGRRVQRARLNRTATEKSPHTQSRQKVIQRAIDSDQPGTKTRIQDLVDRRVVELLADPKDFAFGGWFRDRAASNALRKQQSINDRTRWSRYFDRWGCVSCRAKDNTYGACGFCHLCYIRIRTRLKAQNSHPEKV